MRWLLLGAKLGDMDAQFSVGANYMHGQGVAQNDREAVKWLSLAAEKGDQEAVNNLGLLTWYGRGGLEANPLGALRMWAQSAMQGAGWTPVHNLLYFIPQYPPAMIVLGVTLISLFLLFSSLLRRRRKHNVVS
jgi:TPR repeat protein